MARAKRNKTQMGPLELASGENASCEGMISRWCALTDNVPNVLEKETAKGKFAEYLKELKDGKF